MRPTASIVIPAWNEWELTRACLESLRPTLGLRDQVIVVDNGSVDGTARGLARYPWVTVVSHPQNLGFAAGCNSGTAVAGGDVVIFLNNDTLVPARWLDGLLAPFVDVTVGATGPRSNFVSGPQLVPDVPYDPQRVSELQRFAREWRQEHRGQTTAVQRLVGFCLAVRRELLEELGGFDEQFGLGGAEDDDLCLRLLDAGHRLLITHESFVHHHGHRTFAANDVDGFALQQQNLRLLADKHSAGDSASPVLLSACMIVKNEQENLPSCLTALHSLVDEIVVYDTGSTDETVAIATAAGATVVQGYWNDDFARARNSALEHCRGKWVLQVDADEQVQADATSLRAELTGTFADALRVKIDNVGDDGKITVEHAAVRLFRRGRAHWNGALHERVVPKGLLVLESEQCTTLRLQHGGYTSAAEASGDKVARNLRIARAAVAADGGADLHLKISLARALVAAGLLEEALPHLEDVRSATTQSDLLRHGLRTGADVLLALGRSEDALNWARELRRHSTSTMPDYLEGLALAQAGQADEALEALTRVKEASDEEFSLAQHVAGVHRARILSDAGLWKQAAEELWQLASDGSLPTPSWPALVEAHWRADLGVERLADVLGDEVVPVLARLLNAPVEPFDDFLECLWTRWGADSRLLAAAAQLGPRLSLQRAVDWSLRLRANGLAQECTLASLAASPTAPPLDRLRACGVLHEAVDDPRGAAALREAAAAVPVEDFHAALLALDELSPKLLGPFVGCAASDTRRAKVLADVLTALGATEQAEALLLHSVV
jgi:GT2 family glycosyltransferase/tetratricopeptide (TPR) repeat protein